MFKESAEEPPMHACFFYESDKERHHFLANYFSDGLANNELCIFVTPETPQQVITSFRTYGIDIRSAVSRSAFRIFDMGSSYLSQGKFVADYMLQNVKTFKTDAKQSGYSGLRTAGEMAWLYDNPEFNAEAKQYENDVNSLTTSGSNFIGLCLYPAENSSTKILLDAMHTHPGFIYDGQIRTNPHYQPA